VVALGGFREGQTRQLWTAEEDPIAVEFTSDTKLHFRDATGAEVTETFRAVDIQGPMFIGIERDEGTQIKVDLSRVTVEAKNFSRRKTIGLSVGLGVGVPAAATFVTFLVLLSQMNSGRPLRASAGAAPIRAPFILGRGARGGSRASRRGRALGADEATRARLFAHWANEASAECASIPAFLALARDLRLASAPSALVERALRAAREEASHTALCTALANELAPAEIGEISVRVPPTPANRDVDRRALLERLAMEALWDGCVAEGAAAAAASRSARGASKGAAREALQTIARDEQGHADLSQEIVAYCLSAGGRPIRDALVESLASRRAEEEARLVSGGDDASEGGARIDEDLAQARGLPGGDVERAARAEVWEKSLSMLAHL
jgi:hypothetical protein